MSSLIIHEREQDDTDIERYSKRTKLDDTLGTEKDLRDAVDSIPPDPSKTSDESVEPEHILPPSHTFLGVPVPPVPSDGSAFKILETDVGISEYVGRGVSKIDGIIKQRFTDFLVYEVDLDGQVIHLKSLGKPESPKKDKPEPVESVNATSVIAGEPMAENDAMQGVEGDAGPGFAESKDHDKPSERNDEPIADEVEKDKGKAKQGLHAPCEPWPEHFTTTLTSFLSGTVIAQVKEMFLDGPNPPRVSDRGWGGRPTIPVREGDINDSSTAPDTPQGEPVMIEKAKRGKDRAGRGGRGGGGGRGGRPGGAREDHRKVLSDPIMSKTTRTALHQAIRELFGGKLDTETDSSSVPGEGSRIAIKWAKHGGGRGGRGGTGGSDCGGRPERTPRGTYPPYIHFTLQKTNRDTQDALAHLSRILHVNVKDLSVAGTKDKRGVTVQRVALKRNNKTVEEVWKLANGQTGRRSFEDVLKQRGERGVRVADLNYRKASLELGMLKGNAFVITLRSVQVDSVETLDKALNTIKHKGFINYYGMQRFGTASVPTHSIGLALLKSEWQRAVSLILQKRGGEHPDVIAAREAWLIEGNLDKALELMPRRVVAERCILESYKKQGGETRNAMGALSTIPRNLRLMYIHAYQSYVWNAIVSERIRTYGSDKAVAGDLVFEIELETSPEDQDMVLDNPDGELPQTDVHEPEASSSRSRKKNRKPWVAPRIKTLTEEDLDKYTIFDVIMPLPGTDVAYPGGQLGERYREYLRMDGLDPNNFVRKQRDYTLNGSYRAILHLPKELSWSVLRYTDPDVSLAQADEDKLLGFDAPVIVDDGKFMALQINLTLGTAAYATMALREITKTETSSHFQTSLTQAAEDQKFRGGELAANDEGGET